MKKTSILFLLVLLAFGQTAWAQGLSGSGTEADPYLITSTADWNTFASNVNRDNNYLNEFLKLTADITVTEMAGTSSSKFHGTFDGNGYTLTFNKGTAENPFSEEYCAPFRYIFGATIKNLHVAGTIYTSNKFAGVVGSLDAGYEINLSYITACRSSLTINSSISGDGTHGGFAGLIPQHDSNIHFTDCLFDGQLLGSTTHSCGGFVGWHTGGKVDFTNCLFAPASVTFDTDNSSTFIRLNGNYSTPNYDHCYYKQAFGTAQGTNASDMDNTTLLSNLGATWEIIDGKVVPVMPRRPLTGNGTEQSPYQIASATDWDNLVYNVNTYGETYEGKYFKLMADISVTEMVGGDGTTGNDKCFSGIFDGQGHTITFNVANTTEQYIAPFRRINGATIDGVKLEGTVSSSNRFAGGIVAYAKGTSTVANCMNSTSITTTKDNASNGGIVGMVGASGTLTITGCVFNGEMNGTTNSDETWSGILGLCNTNCTATINDCLVDPVSAVAKGNTIHRTTGQTNCSNCYYTKTIGNAQGKQARSIASGEGVAVAFAGTPSSETAVGVIGYGTGIKYNGTLYAGSGDVVSINVTTPEGYVIGTVTYTPEGGTATEIVPVEGVYSFVMPDADVTINADLVVSLTLEIAGYGDGNDRWAFIASPVEGSILPTAVTNLVGTYDSGTGLYDYDLYRFNPLANLEWENYNNATHHDGFNLVNGMGYLYATKETKTLAFSGTFNTGGEKTIEGLPAGFNLVGNPFTVDAYVSKAYYTLNGDGSAIVAKNANEDQKIAPCHGVIVEVGENETVTFNTSGEFSAGTNKGNIEIALSQEDTRRGTAGRETLMDNAIVTFDEGATLGKFYFGKQNANIYLPQDGEEYAIAYSDKQGEMPLNFKARENGTYTLTVNTENVEVGYLHLIDNMTGADIDLLQTPSYAFDSKTTDYESRFKLVFASEDANDDDEAFAFISDGNLIVNGTGTLQVIDMLGHQLLNRDIHSASDIQHSAFCIQHSTFPSGVYVLRLVNGDSVRTQKIIIQ